MLFVNCYETKMHQNEEKTKKVIIRLDVTKNGGDEGSNGRKLSGKPNQKGVYINNGKQFVIK